MTCRRCGKAYPAKRKTKVYCGGSCRSSYNQRVKKGQAIANPLSETEAYLLGIVLRVAALTESIWTEMSSGVGRISLANVENLGHCVGLAQAERVQQLNRRNEAQQRLGTKGPVNATDGTKALIAATNSVPAAPISGN